MSIYAHNIHTHAFLIAFFQYTVNLMSDNHLDTHLLAKMRRQNHISWQIYAWVFFKSKFLASEATTNDVHDHMKRARADNLYQLLSDEEKEQADMKAFREYVRHKWRPTKQYPSAVRSTYVSRLNFENKLYHYWDSLLGPDKKIEAKQSELVHGQFGLFSACDDFTIPRDVKYIWGDLHPVNCNDEEWEDYHKQYSSCFQAELQMKRKYLYSGPASLANHHCTKSQLSVASGDSVAVSGSKRFKKGEEIFFHYGEHYFTQENPCTCCKESNT